MQYTHSQCGCVHIMLLCSLLLVSTIAVHNLYTLIQQTHTQHTHVCACMHVYTQTHKQIHLYMHNNYAHNI